MASLKELSALNTEELQALNEAKVIGKANGAQAPCFSPITLPLLIGRVNSQKDENETVGRVGIDWLQGTIPESKIKSLKDYITHLTQCAPSHEERGQFLYNNTFHWEPYGINLYFDTPDVRKVQKVNHYGRACLQLTGEALKRFDADMLYMFTKKLVNDFWFICSRIDFAFDDYEHIIQPYEVYNIALQKNFTGYRTFEPKTRFSSGVRTSDTLYFGLRGKNGSGKLLRIYNKNLESKGEINSIRWEVEYSKEKAQPAFERLWKSKNIQEFAEIIAGIIGGSIDFIDRKDKNLKRCKRLEFWQQIVDRLGDIRIRSNQKVKTIETSKSWIEKNVVSNLVMLEKALGAEKYEDWLHTELSKVRLDKSHQDRIKEYKFRIQYSELEGVAV